MKASPSLLQTNLALGDRVSAKDGAGIKFHGYLHHRNGCGQSYVIPDGARQPFYAFPADIAATGERQPGIASTNPVLSDLDRQRVYVTAMQKHRSD